MTAWGKTPVRCGGHPGLHRQPGEPAVHHRGARGCSRPATATVEAIDDAIRAAGYPDGPVRADGPRPASTSTSRPRRPSGSGLGRPDRLRPSPIQARLVAEPGTSAARPARASTDTTDGRRGPVASAFAARRRRPRRAGDRDADPRRDRRRGPIAPSPTASPPRRTSTWRCASVPAIPQGPFERAALMTADDGSMDYRSHRDPAGIGACRQRQEEGSRMRSCDRRIPRCRPSRSLAPGRHARGITQEDSGLPRACVGARHAASAAPARAGDAPATPRAPRPRARRHRARRPPARRPRAELDPGLHVPERGQGPRGGHPRHDLRRHGPEAQPEGQGRLQREQRRSRRHRVGPATRSASPRRTSAPRPGSRSRRTRLLRDRSSGSTGPTRGKLADAAAGRGREGEADLHGDHGGRQDRLPGRRRRSSTTRTSRATA